jgi:hypothetical protein
VNIKRMYHPYWDWECYKAGMWREPTSAEKAELLPIAVTFTGDADLYGSFMMKVIEEWPFACEHHLTDPHINRKAWVGHAACCMAKGCPEGVTRAAWGHLTEEQRAAANIQAGRAISEWEHSQTEERFNPEKERLLL